MNIREPGVAFYSPTNKHSENNSDKRNGQGDRKKTGKYSFLSIEKVSEKLNIWQKISQAQTWKKTTELMTSFFN